MASLTTSHPLDEPVSLTADDARELARLLVLLIREQPAVAAEVTATLRHVQQRAVQPRIETDRRKLILKARAVFSERKRRTHFFKRIMFDEHAWDMLLALYITDFAGGRQTITKLVDWVDAPRTTALRWIDYLERERLIERTAHRDDKRVVFVVLTEKARLVLDEYFSTLPDDVSSV